MSTDVATAADRSLKRKYDDDVSAVPQLTKRQKRKQLKREKALLRASGAAVDVTKHDSIEQVAGALTPTSIEQSPVTKRKSKKDRKKDRKSSDNQIAEGQQIGLKSQKSSKKKEKARKPQTVSIVSLDTPSKKELQETDDATVHQRFSWTLANSQGGLYARRDPIFVDDMLVTAVGQEIRALHITSSLVARTLPARPNETIVSFDAVRTTKERLVRVLYSDGVLVDWDWNSNSVDESRLTANNIDVYRLAIAPGERIASVFTTWSKEHCAVLVDGIASYRTKERIIDFRILHEATSIVARSQNAIIIGRKGEKDSFTWIELSWAQTITCFDAREVNRAKSKEIDIVVGQDNGVLHLYNNVFSVFATSKLPSPRILHWHRTAVRAAKFSHDGTYIISGGQETVLVIWQLATGQKQTLPHLTAVIERIVVSPAGNRYALCMGDNSVMVLSTSELKPVANFAGLQMSLDSQVSAVLDPRTAADRLLLVVPPSQGQELESRSFLQTYDLSSDKHISRQALTRTNVTDFSTDLEGIPIKSPNVQHIQISHDGQWLATVDTWTPPHRDFPHLSTDNDASHEQSRTEVYLKFWQWDATSKAWHLNSRIDLPHANGANPGSVYNLISDSARPGFVTIGEDSMVKIWRPQKKVRQGLVVSTNDQDEVEWKCRLSIELEKYQDRSDLDFEDLVTVGGALALSDDGSLLAVALLQDGGRQVIHFIDTTNGQIKLSKDNIAAPGLVDLAFMDQHLVLLSRQNVRLWDIVNDTLPLKKKITESENPRLAVSKTENAVAVATSAVSRGRSGVYVYKVQPIERSFKTETNVPVAALLSHPHTRGFKLILEDGTIQTLSSSSGLSTAQKLVLATQKATEEELDAVRVSVEERMLQEPKQLLDDATMMLASAPSAEDDRSVVRPEEFAKVFDVGPNPSALPSVRDMFHAIAGLFARKPLTV